MFPMYSDSTQRQCSCLSYWEGNFFQVSLVIWNSQLHLSCFIYYLIYVLINWSCEVVFLTAEFIKLLTFSLTWNCIIEVGQVLEHIPFLHSYIFENLKILPGLVICFVSVHLDDDKSLVGHQSTLYWAVTVVKRNTNSTSLICGV